ncbi:hypothetical protein Psi01_83770 [Planobispora siamensis]|uniref:Uncharacterized protein n=1 Tax=Planobispora siamensis TaxID=936338 RepID=A0A8J3SP49_9ACTN|nr:hypothetical protein Psi01_83770 [Planobispora siamensis]
MRAAYHAETVLEAQAALSVLVAELEVRYPGAAASLREGLEETLTVLRLGVPPTLARTLRSTNPIWGYRRVHGELAVLGIAVAPSTVWEILKQEDLDPVPERASTTWADFLRSQAETLLADNLIETVTLTGQRQYILAVTSMPPGASGCWALPPIRSLSGPSRR